MIRVEIRENCHILQLNRPEKANALTEEMLFAIARGAEAAASAGVGILILTGAGRVFSAGADLNAVANGLSQSPAWERAATAIAAFSGLSVAALNGTLAGGAFGIALACDLRLAVAEAEFFYPVMKRGYLPFSADARRLSALMGPARCKRLLLCGERLSAPAALEAGLIDQILPGGEDLTEAALQLAGDAAHASPAHLAAIKALIPAL